jgi:hypothetical protein
LDERGHSESLLSNDKSAQLYIRDIMLDLSKHFSRITKLLRVFRFTGLRTIRSAQEHDAGNLFNISTIATFFSGVTATTLQMSYMADGSMLEQTVNTFYFASLIFSVAAAINSVLGLAWRRAP